MRHYEIVFIVHPDQSEQVPGMIDRYRQLVDRDGGTVHRCEDWGRRQLAYPIAKIHKAHYVLMNIEVEMHTLSELESGFQFNDAVLRTLTIKRKKAETEHSKIYKEELKEQQKKQEREIRQEAELQARRRELEVAHVDSVEPSVTDKDVKHDEDVIAEAEVSPENEDRQETEVAPESEDPVETEAESVAEESDEGNGSVEGVDAEPEAADEPIAAEEEKSEEDNVEEEED